MVVASVILMALLIKGKRIGRLTALLMLASYGAYSAYLYLSAAAPV